MERSPNLEAWLKGKLDPDRILLVEDNPDDVSLFVKFSISHHVTIQVAQNADEAADILSACVAPVRMVFLDWVLRHGPAGIEAFKLMRSAANRLDPTPDVPVVVLSAIVNATMVDQMAEIGFSATIRKPTCYTQRFFDSLFSCFNIPKL